MDSIGFWIFMFICAMLIPVTMIIFGVKFLRKAPKNINYTYGYRTTRSMKNRDTWEFAHKQIGSLWKRIGIALLPCSAVVMLFFIGMDIESIGLNSVYIIFIQLVFMVFPIFIVEKRLKNSFDKYGQRKANRE